MVQNFPNIKKNIVYAQMFPTDFIIDLVFGFTIRCNTTL